MTMKLIKPVITERNATFQFIMKQMLRYMNIL